LGDENYGIDVSRVRQVMKDQPITRVARQPPYVEGVINFKGTKIPVVNLRKRFDLKGETSQHPHMVILDMSEGMVGVLVDSVSEILRLPKKRVLPPPMLPGNLEGEYVRRIYQLGDKRLLYLDVERIIRNATPVANLQAARLGMVGHGSKSRLDADEEKMLKAINLMNMSKARLKRKTRFSESRLSKTISSLKRKGILKISKTGKRRIISISSAT
jgi:purine-binding chemotaxis protein CheW